MPRTRSVQFSPLICSTAVLTFFVICKNYTISSSNERLESHLPKRSPQSWRTMPSSTIFFLPFFRHIAAISDIYQIEEAFVNFIKGVSGGDPGMTRRQYSRRIDKFVRDIKTSFHTLGRAIVKLECSQMQFRFLQKAELEKTDTPPPAKPRKRGRIGSGLHGKRTQRMNDQLAEFRTWIVSHHINENDRTKTVGARALQYWKRNEKSFAYHTKCIGESKGFKNPRSLANAYRKSKSI